MFVEKLTEEEKIACMEYVYKECGTYVKGVNFRIWEDVYIDDEDEDEEEEGEIGYTIDVYDEDCYDLIDRFCIRNFTCSANNRINVGNMELSYRTYMYNKFGEEYLQELKKHLLDEKNERIKKIEDKYKGIFTVLNKKLNMAKKPNNENDNIFSK